MTDVRDLNDVFKDLSEEKNPTLHKSGKREAHKPRFRDTFDTHTVATAHVNFSDVPDCDNFLMHTWHILLLIKQNPHVIVAINVSFKPTTFDCLSFAAYDKYDFAAEVQGALRLLHPVHDKAGRKDVPAHLKHWFAYDYTWEDNDARDGNIVKDAELHLHISVLRLMVFLAQHGVYMDNYRIYADFELLKHQHLRSNDKNKMEVSIHHPAEVLDHTWGMNFKELRAYWQAVDRAKIEFEAQPVDQKDIYIKSLGIETRGLLHKVIERVRKALNVPHPRDIVRDISELIEANEKAGIKADILVGGPFTEPLRFVEKSTVMPKRIYAMACNVMGDRNLFEEQFNLMTDRKAAQSIFKLTKERRISLFVLPTECAKQDPSVVIPNRSYAFTHDDVKRFAEASPAAGFLIRNYYARNFNDPNATSPLFDLVTAVVMMHDEVMTGENSLLTTYNANLELTYYPKARPAIWQTDQKQRTKFLESQQKTEEQLGLKHEKPEDFYRLDKVFLSTKSRDGHVTMNEEDETRMARKKEYLMRLITGLFSEARDKHGFAMPDLLSELVGGLHARAREGDPQSQKISSKLNSNDAPHLHSSLANFGPKALFDREKAVKGDTEEDEERGHEVAFKEHLHRFTEMTHGHYFGAIGNIGARFRRIVNVGRMFRSKQSSSRGQNGEAAFAQELANTDVPNVFQIMLH